MTPGGQAQIGNVDLVKQLNSAAVYRLIDQHGPISRIQIAEQSQLAPASVTKITRQLIERGLIKEVDQQASTGGRRAISIITETRNFQAIGVRLGRHDTTLTLYDLSSKAIAEEHYPLPERTQETLEHALLNTIAQFIESCQRKIRELIAISVILPGLVDPESGVIRYMPHIPVENWGLVDALEKRFKVTCFVGHDIRSLALAEHYFGASQDCEDSILVRVHRERARALSLTAVFSLVATVTSVRLATFRLSPLGSAATAAISAVLKPSPPTRPLSSAFAICLNRVTKAASRWTTAK